MTAPRLNLPEKYHQIFNWLWHPIDSASLVFFRICFAILGVADMVGTLVYKHWMKNHMDPEQFQFRFIGFEWLPTFSDPWMSIILLIFIAAGIGIAIGWRYRLCASIWAIGFTYTFLLEKAYYLNHSYFYCLLCALMIFLPANARFSADVLSGRAKWRKTIPRWSLGILCFMMGLVYFYGGIAKINADWLQAIPLKTWLSNKSDIPIIGTILEIEATAWFMSYGGLFFDLSVAWLLLFRRTRLFALGMAIFFHLTNTIIFKIGIFPWLSLVMSLLFFPPDLPIKVINRLAQHFNWVRRVEVWWDGKMEDIDFTGDENQESYGFRYRKLIMTSLAIFCLIQLTLPFRHHLFSGDVAWTEEGHRYSWRMMLRSKSGYGSFRVVDKTTNEVRIIRPSKRLSKRQNRKLFTHPDMIWQYAQHLKKEALLAGADSVAVYADIQVRLNQRERQKFIDDTVDLGSVKWEPFKSAYWILRERR